MDENDLPAPLRDSVEHHRAAHGSEIVILCDGCSLPICELCSGGFELIDGVEMHYCKLCAQEVDAESRQPGRVKPPRLFSAPRPEQAENLPSCPESRANDR